MRFPGPVAPENAQIPLKLRKLGSGAGSARRARSLRLCSFTLCFWLGGMTTNVVSRGHTQSCLRARSSMKSGILQAIDARFEARVEVLVSAELQGRV